MKRVKEIICLLLALTFLSTFYVPVYATEPYSEYSYILNCSDTNPLSCSLQGNTLTAYYTPNFKIYDNIAIKVGDIVEYATETNGTFELSISLQDLDINKEYPVKFYVQTEPTSLILTSLSVEDCVIVYSYTLGWHFKKFDNYTNNYIKYYEYSGTTSGYVNSEVKQFATDLVYGVYDDYSRVQKLYNWVCDNIYYDMDYYTGTSGSLYYSAYDVYKQRHTVCEGYANLMKAFCLSIGVPCKVVEQVDNTLGNHVWNEAFIDGQWVIIDATYGSSNKYSNKNYRTNINETMKAKYFDIPLNNLSEDHLITDYRIAKDYLSFDKHSKWAEDELIEAIDYGLIQDNYVRGFQNDITRGEFCDIIVAYVNIQLRNKDKFGNLTNTQINDLMNRGLRGAKIPFKSEEKNITSSIVFCYVNNIVNGKSDNWFDVNGSITREDAACMIYRTISYLNSINSNYTFKWGIKKVYRDRHRISNYAEESVNYLSKVKILLGDNNSNFNPKGNITVEQSYLTLIRLFKSYM